MLLLTWWLSFAKAFDKVPHERLLLKLFEHGILGKVLTWIRNWLSDRKQRVCISGEQSTWRPVWSGVPQGSNLGPVLFLIFINDIDCGIVNWILKFADDTKVFANITDDKSRELLQQDLNTLFEWSQNWHMEFNTQKCKVTRIGRSNPGYTYMMNGLVLE